MEALGDDYDSEAAKDAERLKLGRRKGSTNKKNVESRRKYACSVTQAGVASEYDNLPSVTYPEIALCGRSNCGKSSLLNALCGMAPDNGVASVSSRPGWTSSSARTACCERRTARATRAGSATIEDGLSDSARWRIWRCARW